MGCHTLDREDGTWSISLSFLLKEFSCLSFSVGSALGWEDPPLFLFFSLTASQPPYGKPLLVLSSSLDLGVRRSSSVSLLISNGFSTSLRQSPPGFVIAARFCGHDQARLTVCYANQRAITDLDKRVPMNLVYPHIHNELMMIKRKRIPLPPLVTLPNQNHHQRVNVLIFSRGWWGLCRGCQVLGSSAQLLQARWE